VILPLLNGGDKVDSGSEGKQAHAAEKNDLVGHA